MLFWSIIGEFELSVIACKFRYKKFDLTWIVGRVSDLVCLVLAQWIFMVRKNYTYQGIMLCVMRMSFACVLENCAVQLSVVRCIRRPAVLVTALPMTLSIKLKNIVDKININSQLCFNNCLLID